MTLYKIYSDTHYFGVAPIKSIDIEEQSTNTILVGDIVDLYQCKEKNKFEAQSFRSKLEKIHGHKYVFGNHECTLYGNNKYIEHGIVFTHGDLGIFWEYSRGIAFRAKPHCTGNRLLGKIINFGRKLYSAKLTESDKKNAIYYAKQNTCHTIVLGHKHPKKVIDVTFEGIRIVVVPRGKTEIHL